MITFLCQKIARISLPSPHSAAMNSAKFVAAQRGRSGIYRRDISTGSWHNPGTNGRSLAPGRATTRH
jgi:hypothetical protein